MNPIECDMLQLVFGQRLDLPAIAGIGLILAGIVVIRLFSKTATPGL